MGLRERLPLRDRVALCVALRERVLAGRNVPVDVPLCVALRERSSRPGLLPARLRCPQGASEAVDPPTAN